MQPFVSMMPNATPRDSPAGPVRGDAVPPVGLGQQPARHHQRPGPPAKASCGIWACPRRPSVPRCPMPTRTAPVSFSKSSFIGCLGWLAVRPSRLATGTSSASRTSRSRLTPPPSSCAPQSSTGGQFRRTKGAVKLHLMLDHDGLLPCHGVITDGKQHEVTVTRQWSPNT